MPWEHNEEVKHKTRKARTEKQKRQWREIANSVLEHGGSEGSAIRQASGVIKKRNRGK